MKVVLPKTGMGIEEGTVLRWLKAVGEVVEKGEALVEIETAKATMQVEAPARGRLVKVLLRKGETAPVDAEIAEIDELHE